MTGSVAGQSLMANLERRVSMSKVDKLELSADLNTWNFIDPVTEAQP